MKRISIIRSLLSVVLIICAFSTVSLAAASWKTFTSSADKFKVDFPNKPTFSTKKVKIPDSDLVIKHNTYKSEGPKQRLYYVIVTSFNLKLDTSNPDENLKSLVNDLVVSDKGNKLASSKLGKFKGYRSIDFLILNGTFYMKGKMFFVNQKAYELAVASFGDEYDSSEYNKFVNSFSVK